MDMIDRYKLNDRVIIQGNTGDHTFWHDRFYVLYHAVHRWNEHNAEQIWDKCLTHYGFGGPPGPTGFYSKESRIDEINKYISNPRKDFATSKDLRGIINQPRVRRILKGHFGKVYAMHWSGNGFVSHRLF